MKKHLFFIASLLCISLFAGCGNAAEPDIEPQVQITEYLRAVVMEINDDTVLVECTDCTSDAIPVGSEVLLNLNAVEEFPVLVIGDSVKVAYIGVEIETYPFQLDNTVSIFRLDENGIAITEPVEDILEEVENPDWGITLTAENVTPTSCVLHCYQSGGEPTGMLETGGEFIIEKWTEENDWQEVPYVTDNDVAWHLVGFSIKKEGDTTWDVKWEFLYGTLPEGKYRIGKNIMNSKGAGHYSTAMFYAEFIIGIGAEDDIEQS